MADESNSLEGKTILFVGSGNKKKKFTLKVAKDLGLNVVLINKNLSWQRKYVNKFIQADTYNHDEVLSKVDNFIKNENVDGAITFWEDDVPLWAKICDNFNFVGIDYKTAEKARDKYQMRKCFKENNLPCPKFFLIKNKNDLKKAIEEINFPAVIKPCWGSDSEFVIKVENEEKAEYAFDYVQKSATPKFNPIFHYNQGNFLYEEYMEGYEVNVESLTQNSLTRIISISDKMLMKEPYFIEQGDYIPTRYENEMRKKISDLVIETHKAIGIKNAVSHTEVKITKEGPKVVEIAARMGGDYLYDWVKTVYGIDLVEEALKIALGIPIDLKINSQPSCYLVGKYFIPDYSGIISGIRGLKDLKGFEGIHKIYFSKKIGDPILVPPEGFQNIGWIVTKGDSHLEAEKNLNFILSNIEITVSRFRPDSSIGQTVRRNPFSPAILSRNRILRGAKIERIRLLKEKEIKNLHVGVLCNIYKNNGANNLVEQDLTSVGMNIKNALESKGHKVTFFDMNEYPLPFEKIQKSGVDIVFNVCERINDSSLLEPHSASLLDMLQIPYTGSSPQTLSICIDKIRVKKLLSYHGIPTAKWDYLYSIEDEIREDLEYPLIVKPANTDNSIGITNDSVVRNKEELMRQLKKVILEERRPALIEEYIDGDEFDVSILGNEDNLKVLPISRSIFDDLPNGYWHIYPFEAKWYEEHEVYDKIKSERPAKISKNLSSLLTELAIDTYNILDCYDYGRVEFRVDKEGNPYVLELNPNPSINVGDCVPACAELIGMSYADFIEEILLNAVKRYKDKPPYYHLMTSKANI